MNVFGWQLKQLVANFEFWKMAFAPVGIMWTLTEMAIQISTLDTSSAYLPYVNIFLPYLWIFIPLGFVLSICKSWPKRTISVLLPNTDTIIEVCVGNIFKSKNPIVVAIPTTLETEFNKNAIDKDSVQGQFTAKYCKNPSNLSTAITIATTHAKNFKLVTNYYSEGKTIKKFEPGEVFVIRDFKRTGYLLAFATFNKHGNAQISQEDFYDLLPKLWLGIQERGDIGNIDIPLLGAKFGRLQKANRREILRELINSFSAASSESRLADKVTFYIRPSDFTRGGFSFESIHRLLLNVSDDHTRNSNNTNIIGKEIS